jgi:WD40 repeat protein
VAFSPDGTRVMAGDVDISAVQIWDLGPTADAEWANLPAPGASQVEFMPDGRRVVTSRMRDRAVTIWDLQTGRELRTIGPATDFFRFESFDVSPDGSSIALGGSSTRNGFGGAAAARAWDTSTGEELWRIGHEFDVSEVSFSPDGEHLVTASWDETAKIVDRSGRVIRVLRERGFSLDGARFSADGSLVATLASEESTRVTIWDWLRGEVARTIEVGHTYDPHLAFDPSGPRIAIGSSEGLAEIRDVASGRRVAVLHGPPEGVTDIAYSPNGSRVAVATADGTVRLFDADTGAPQLVLPGPGCTTSTVAFSPDGTKLASASPCDGVRIWALDIADLLEIARREVARPLTDDECRQYLHVDRCPQL